LGICGHEFWEKRYRLGEKIDIALDVSERQREQSFRFFFSAMAFLHNSTPPQVFHPFFRIAIPSQHLITVLLILHLIDNILLLLTTKKQHHTMLTSLLLRGRGRSRHNRQRSLQRSDGKGLLADRQGAEERTIRKRALTEHTMLLSGGRSGGSSTVDDSEGVIIGRGRGTSTSRGRGGG
jgi:hypothetical protein